MDMGMMGYDAQWHGYPWVWIGHFLWFLLFAGLALALVAAVTRDGGRDRGGGGNPRDEFPGHKRDLI